MCEAAPLESRVENKRLKAGGTQDLSQTVLGENHRSCKVQSSQISVCYLEAAFNEPWRHHFNIIIRLI